MDKWIQSFTQSLIQFFKAEMDAYRLYTVVPKLVKFVDMLTNWYVRTNRRRLKGESGTEDCLWALETLFSVLFSMCRLMAPFTPFITEMMYQNLRHLIDPASVEEKDSSSIHYLMLPQVRESLIDKRIESAVSQMQSVIELGRVIRDRKTLPVKYPLREVVVIHQDPEALRDIQSLQKYILEELNVRQLTLSTDKDKYGIRLRAEPDHMVLGKRLKGAFKSVTASIKELKSEQLEAFQKTGGSVLWAASCGQRPVGSVLWAASCGQCPVGQRPVGQRPVGQRPVGSVLWASVLWTVRDDSSSAAAQCSVGHPLVLHQWPQDALATGRCPTGRCPTGRCPTGRCPTGRCPTGRAAPQDAHILSIVFLQRTVQHSRLKKAVLPAVSNKVEVWTVSGSCRRPSRLGERQQHSPLMYLDALVGGSIMVDGHELHEEDLRLMYSFDQAAGSATQYEAHSDAQVLVLLDITPDQSMLDEGVAREVINRIQKLRKKGHLVPSDEITVYYSSEPAGDYLDKVIQAHTDFILATTKAPLLPYPVPKNASVIVQERTQLKGSDLDLTIIKGAAVSRAPLTGPACAHVNIKVNLGNKQQEGAVLLENPKGDSKLDVEKLKMVCRAIFKLSDAPLAVFSGTAELKANSDLLALSGKTLSVTSGASPKAADGSDSLVCPYINLQLVNASPAECLSGSVGTLLLANPVGQNGLQHAELLGEVAKVFGLRGRRLKLYTDEDLTEAVLFCEPEKRPGLHPSPVSAGAHSPACSSQGELEAQLLHQVAGKRRTKRPSSELEEPQKSWEHRRHEALRDHQEHESQPLGRSRKRKPTNTALLLNTDSEHHTHTDHTGRDELQTGIATESFSSSPALQLGVLLASRQASSIHFGMTHEENILFPLQLSPVPIA
ncbi:hypothetical protein NFI96_016352 [Prochilodus magdalenae]|nr:hypothetical protein NFI96_016352 [Prochilodus magdalenae]